MSQHDRLFVARLRRERDGTRIVLRGELDLVTARVLERTVRRAARGGRGPTLIDVSGLTFCDLAGQRMLLHALGAGSPLVGTSPRCLSRLFELTGYPAVLPASAAQPPPSSAAEASGGTSLPAAPGDLALAEAYA